MERGGSSRRIFRIRKIEPSRSFLSLVVCVVATWFLRPKVEVGLFTVIGHNEVKNSVGFSFKMSPSELVYREGLRQITLRPDAAARGSAMFKINSALSLRWDEPPDAAIGKEQQEKIRARITRAIAFLQSASRPEKR